VGPVQEQANGQKDMIDIKKQQEKIAKEKENKRKRARETMKVWAYYKVKLELRI
jgi:hypothetical protein